mgnify:CR=1 FL=1
MPKQERPLGPLQRNWLRFLEANPGPHYADLSLRQLEVLESLQRRGLVTLADNGTRTPKGRTVYVMQALQPQEAAQ